jgi:hypothetical protein
MAMTSEIMSETPGEAAIADERDCYIPVRKADILNALLERTPEGHDRTQFHRFSRLVGAVYHYEYFELLERLRNDYFYFNPELEPHAHFERIALDRTYKDLVDALRRVLEDAGFIEMSHAEIERAHRERPHLRVEIEAPLDAFREIRFFRRGHHKGMLEVSGWFGLRRREVEMEIYDDVVLFVALKSAGEALPARSGKRRGRLKARPGAILIKYFSNIAIGDLNALIPDVRVVLSMFDKLMLALPALVGGIPIVLNLIPTLSVLLLLVGFYLGISGEVEGDRTKSALAAVTGIVAFGGFVMRQWVKYERQSLMYQKQLTDNVYYRNVNNNSGIFDAIIGAAEEQECKEATLAYHFLLTASDKPTQAVLDRRIESWVKQTFGIDVMFECDEALTKLDRLGLLRRDGDTYAVAPLDEALLVLDRLWSGFFPLPDGHESERAN